MHLIFGNYGNNTIALIQWAVERQLTDVKVLHVDTGWAAQSWSAQVTVGQALVRQYGMEAITLQPPQTFADQIADRGQFPSVKFQWCAAFLKGLAFSVWADQNNPTCSATVLMGSRRADSRARFDLQEFDDHNEYFGDRRVWYPLFDHADNARDQLIMRAGFDVLPHRSLECLPCVFNAEADMRQMSTADRARVNAIETAINNPIAIQVTDQHGLEGFDMGCGSRYGCGE